MTIDYQTFLFFTIIVLLVFGLMLINSKRRVYKNKYNQYKKAYEEFVPPKGLICKPTDEYSTYVQKMSAVEQYGKIIDAIIPKNYELLSKYFTDFFIYEKAKENGISGDYFFVEEYKNRLIFGVFDSPGYNIAGLLSHLYTRSFIQHSIYKEGAELNASILLNRIDARLGNLLKDYPEYSIHLYCALCCWEKDKNLLSFSGGRLPLLHIRNNKLNKIFPNSKTIGDFRINSQFENHEISIHEGDLLYLATDGFEDQFRGKDEVQYQFKYRSIINSSSVDKKNSFDDLLLDISKIEMSQQSAIVNDELENWWNQKNKNFRQYDDILVVGLKF